MSFVRWRGLQARLSVAGDGLPVRVQPGRARPRQRHLDVRHPANGIDLPSVSERRNCVHGGEESCAQGDAETEDTATIPSSLGRVERYARRRSSYSLASGGAGPKSTQPYERQNSPSQSLLLLLILLPRPFAHVPYPSQELFDALPIHQFEYTSR